MTDATGKLQRWHLRLSKFDFDIFYRADIKHLEASASSGIATTRMETFPLGDDVLALMVNEAQPEEEKIGAHGNIWHISPNNDPVDTVKASLPEVLNVSVNTDKERQPTVMERVNKRADDPYSMEAANIVGKPESVYSYEGNRVLTKHIQSDSVLQMVVSNSLHEHILDLAHYSVLSGHPSERGLYNTLQRKFYWPHMTKMCVQNST